jgi:ribosomal protein L21
VAAGSEGKRARHGASFMAPTISERSHMYAVIKTGGKQYKVAAGEKIKVEQIAADVGQEIVIDQVLAVGNGAELKVGTPWVAGANVKATVVLPRQARQGAHLQDAPPQALSDGTAATARPTPSCRSPR